MSFEMSKVIEITPLVLHVAFPFHAVAIHFDYEQTEHKCPGNKVRTYFYFSNDLGRQILFFSKNICRHSC